LFINYSNLIRLG